MTQQTAGELLVLALLAFTSARIFFLKKVKADVVSTIPLIALLLSVLNVLAWGVGAAEIAVLLLSLFVTIWNVRAMLRLVSKVVIDHYSGLFTLISIINLLLTAALASLIILFSPVHASLAKFEVVRADSAFTGSFEKGFDRRTNPLLFPTAKLSVFSPLDKETAAQKSPSAFSRHYSFSSVKPEPSAGKKGIILFVPGKCATIDSWQPVLVKLAHDGYTVYAAEFYADDMEWFPERWKNASQIRRFAFMHDALSQDGEPDRSARTADFAAEYRALLSMAHPVAADNVIVLADKDQSHALGMISAMFPSIIDTTFDFADVSGYESAGFGPVEQTEPLLAKLRFNMDKDRTLFTSSHLATVLEQALGE